MAVRSNKLFVVSLVFFLLLVQVLAETYFNDIVDGGEEATLYKKHHHQIHHSTKINCSSACARRCRKASRNKICKRACGTCCKRCNCVPPGTYGNKGACPCYAKLRTHGGRPKCP